MADISALFDDALAEVEIVNKLDGKPLGIKMWIAPFAADESANAWFRSRYLLERSKSDDVDSDAVAEFAVQADIRRIAASVRKWDWGGHSWADLGENPACTNENKLKVFSDSRASFIVEQLMQKAVALENFTAKPDAI